MTTHIIATIDGKRRKFSSSTSDRMVALLEVPATHPGAIVEATYDPDDSMSSVLVEEYSDLTAEPI